MYLKMKDFYKNKYCTVNYASTYKNQNMKSTEISVH